MDLAAALGRDQITRGEVREREDAATPCRGGIEHGGGGGGTGRGSVLYCRAPGGGALWWVAEEMYGSEAGRDEASKVVAAPWSVRFPRSRFG